MALNNEEKEKLICEINCYDYIRFVWIDIHGISRCKSVPRRHAAAMLDNGLGIPEVMIFLGPSSEFLVIPSLTAEGYGNGTARPAISSVYPLPWFPCHGLKIGEVLCETYLSDGGAQLENPRLVARRQLDELANKGYKLMSGFECELYAERSNSDKPLFKATNEPSTYCLAGMESFLYNVEQQLASIGIDVMSIGIEGGAEQSKFVLSPKFGIRSADNVFRLKEAIKEIGNVNGLDVSFMTQPYKEVCNELHFNHSVWTADESSNAFYDHRTPDNHLSETFYHWLAGLIEHGPGMAALAAPTVNCYRRFALPFMSPAHFDWDFDHHLTSFGIRATSPTATYIENRLPSGSANPYLVLAATVAAGLDGINRRLACPSPRDMQAKPIPKSLDEALDALENDKVLVEALGQQFVNYFTAVKRGIEMKTLKDSVLDNPDDSYGFQKERDIYFRHL